MLIDAGENGKGEAVLAYLDELGIKELDYVVGTHPHSDHIGGMDTVLQKMAAKKVLLPDVEHTTQTYEDFIDAVIACGAEAFPAQVGYSGRLGEATFTVLAPCGENYTSLNNYSVVLRVELGDISFLLTGDAEALSEKEMLNAGLVSQATVLKLGHHGSSTSTSQEFLDRVAPQYAVICLGQGNTYLHPHRETCEKLEQADIDAFWTQNGHVVAITNGRELTFNRAPDTITYPVKEEDKPVQDLPVQTLPPPQTLPDQGEYIGNLNSLKFHKPSCRSLPAEKNRVYFESRQQAVNAGYEPCGSCKP